MDEEKKMIQQDIDTEVLSAYTSIPYALINSELKDSSQSSEYLAEMGQIMKFYTIYRKGNDFPVEGSHGDYVPANLRYKMASSLVNKEARFLFGETPDITLVPPQDAGKLSDEQKRTMQGWNSLVRKVLKQNHFESQLLKAAKDCFIGKRVAALVNFNTEDGITLTFLPATQFVFETKNNDINLLTKFVAFIVIQEALSSTKKRIFKKKYEVVYNEVTNRNEVYLSEGIYDGTGTLMESLIENRLTNLQSIPAVVFLNDGLTGDLKGESEIDLLKDFELWYSKLSSADIDAERKSMYPTKYTVDMDPQSTKNLSSGVGAFWDLQSDQNLDKPAPAVGTIEPAMSYSETLKTSLDRIKTVGYEQIDMPNITLETMQGSITSGKALKAIYWPLIVRCKEKMKMWGPSLAAMIDIIVLGAKAYPHIQLRYVDDELLNPYYEVHVEQVLPLPEDEDEEKQLDIAEVEAKVMSRKAYMKKWRYLSDEEVEEELRQIAYERQVLEDAEFMPDIDGYNANLPSDERQSEPDELS